MIGRLSAVVVLIAIGAWYALSRTSTKASSVLVLALNYLARPNALTASDHVYQPIDLPSVWNGSYMAANPHIWIYELDSNDKHAVRSAVQHFQSLNMSMEQLTPKDFPLSEDFLTKIENWKLQLSGKGRGFQVLRGVPVREWSMTQSEIFFFALGKYLGIPGAQDVEGSLLGHVVDVGVTDKVERPYRKRVDIAYHCDGADVVGLLCMHSAKKGGASRIISSARVYNELLKHPKGQQYVKRLFGKILLFTRKTFGLSSYLPVYPLRLDSEGVLRTYWNQEFYLKSYRDLVTDELTERGREDPFALEAVEAYDAILNKDIQRGKAREQQQETGAVEGEGNEETAQEENSDELGLSMFLQQGDVQLVSNHFVLHARTEFEDYTPEEISAAAAAAVSANPHEQVLPPLGKRELLRLWVSHPFGDLSWAAYLSKQVDFLRVMAAVVEGVAKYR